MSTVKRRYSRQSARKVRSVLATIRNKQALQAYNQTLFVNRKSAHDIALLIKSGMDACIKKNADENKLYISEARADQGPAMKRRWLHARGQSTQFKKEFCHIIISLTEKDDITSNKVTHTIHKDTVRLPSKAVSVSKKVSAQGKE